MERGKDDLEEFLTQLFDLIRARLELETQPKAPELLVFLKTRTVSGEIRTVSSLTLVLY